MFRASLFNQLGSSVVTVGMGKSILVVALRLIGKTAFAGAGGKDKAVMCICRTAAVNSVRSVARCVRGVNQALAGTLMQRSGEVRLLSVSVLIEK